MPDLSGKVAIVTGAGRYRGIGRDTALALARAGADVAVTGTGRSPDTFPDDEKEMGWRDIDSVADENPCHGTPRHDHRRRLGRSRPSPRNRGADRSRTGLRRHPRQQRRIRDGRRSVSRLSNSTTPIWHRVLDIKVHGSYYASKAAAQAMIRQGTGGSIIMVSSIAGKIHPRNFAAYVVANMSLQGLTGSLSKELGDHDINVNTVCPGVIDTSRWDNKRDNTPTGREDWERLETNIPMGRPGTGTDVASTIVFLCSQEAHWISGQSINIDGGQVSSH